jgi:hypothetical protein
VQFFLRKLKLHLSFIFEFEFGTSLMILLARAWMLDAVLDVDSHPHLLNVNCDEGEISHEYVKKMLKYCES